MSGDTRSFTAHDLHNLSSSMRKAGSIYGKGYNLANAAFATNPSMLNKTHTQGFDFKSNRFHKYAYGDEGRPKIAGKDIL